MAKSRKTLSRVLSRTADASIRFDDLRGLLHALRFEERIRGDHQLFFREGIVEILNLQPRGHQAKVYQVKQVRDVLLKYGLVNEDDVNPS